MSATLRVGIGARRYASEKMRSDRAVKEAAEITKYKEAEAKVPVYDEPRSPLDFKPIRKPGQKVQKIINLDPDR